MANLMPPSKTLVGLIEQHAAELTNQWLDLVQKDPRTTTYHGYDRTELYGYAYSVYHELGKWLSKDTTKEDIAKFYTVLGNRRRIQGFKLSEVIHALILTRRVLWYKILSEGLLDTAIDLNRALDLNNHTIVFFDRATYYISLGFEKEGSLTSDIPPKMKSPMDKIMDKTDFHWVP
jgi:hypothetical protein